MTQHFAYPRGFKPCGHHRLKYLRRNFMGHYLFMCVRPSCKHKIAIAPLNFWSHR